MKASEARKLVKESGKSLSVEGLFNSIEKVSKDGRTMFRIVDQEFDISLISVLIENGYKIEESKGFLNEKIITISW